MHAPGSLPGLDLWLSVPGLAGVSRVNRRNVVCVCYASDQTKSLSRPENSSVIAQLRFVLVAMAAEDLILARLTELLTAGAPEE